MRFLVIPLFLGLVVGGAWAQGAADDDRFQAEWVDRGPDYNRYFPIGAMEDRTSGTVQLCCTPKANRHLDCRIGREWPEGRGFGHAALRAAREMRMTQASYDQFVATP